MLRVLPSRVFRRAAVAFAVCVGTVGLNANTVQAADDIEEFYEATGSWSSVSQISVTDPSDPTPWDDSYTIFYPTNLGAGGYDHPIITWGNGSDASPADYADLLTHLASWGYVVVAPDSGWVGNGYRMLAGAQYMVSENSNSSSVFFGNLDVAKIGSAGHSQGSGGAIWSALDSNGLIQSTVALSFPNTWTWCTGTPPPGEPGCVRYDAGDEAEFLEEMEDFSTPLFLPRGNLDGLATSDWSTDVALAVDGMGATASRRFCLHITCPGVVGDLGDNTQGYITAWLEYTLKGDTYARGAFHDPGSSNGEIFTNALWEDVTVKDPI